LELKKDIVKKKKVNFLLDILNQNFVPIHLKKNSSLAHREVPQIYVGSAARNTFAARKILAAHCRTELVSEDIGKRYFCRTCYRFRENPERRIGQIEVGRTNDCKYGLGLELRKEFPGNIEQRT
jgi:hypothetical protein